MAIRLRYRYLLILVPLGVALLAVSTRRERLADHPFFTARGFQVIAHRGGLDLGPESTMVVYRRARELGVDVLEVDVRTTADGVLVAFHDRRVDRTTDGSGRVETMTLSQLQALDAGYSWSADGTTYPFRGRGLRIATLADIFEAFPDQLMCVESKSRGAAMADALCGVVREHGMGERVVVASFDDETLVEFRAACPEVATSASAVEVLWYWLLLRLRLDALYDPAFDVLQVPAAIRWLTVVDRRFVDSARERNIPVHVWTVNGEDEMRRLVDLGVDGIITDNSGVLLQVLRERSLR